MINADEARKNSAVRTAPAYRLQRILDHIEIASKMGFRESRLFSEDDIPEIKGELIKLGYKIESNWMLERYVRW